MTRRERKQYINVMYKMLKGKKVRSPLFNKITRVYRYRSLSNEYELENISQNQIWLSCVTELNDPYDFSVNIDVSEILKKDRRLNRVVRTTYKKLNEERKRKLIYQIKREKKEEQKDLDERLEAMQKKMGAACFSESYDSLLMWSHYADYHRGVCLEYDVRDIIEKFTFCPVIYRDEFLSVAKYIRKEQGEYERRCVELILTKAKVWDYEKEWRIIDKLPEGGDEKGKILEGLKPRRILMGCRISDENEKEIIKAANGLQIPAQKMKMDTGKFRIYIDG